MWSEVDHSLSNLTVCLHTHKRTHAHHLSLNININLSSITHDPLWLINSWVRLLLTPLTSTLSFALHAQTRSHKGEQKHLASDETVPTCAIKSHVIINKLDYTQIHTKLQQTYKKKNKPKDKFVKWSCDLPFTWPQTLSAGTIIHLINSSFLCDY